MENIPSSVVMAVSGIIIGCLLISTFLFNYNATKKVTGDGISQQDEITANVDEQKFEKYETILSGADTFTAVKELTKNDTILVYVDNGTNTVRYANENMSSEMVTKIQNDTDLSHISHTAFSGDNPVKVSKTIFKQMSDRSTKDTYKSFFIDKLQHYQGYLLRNTSSDRISMVFFVVVPD